jgi:hypothetical protein
VYRDVSRFALSAEQTSGVKLLDSVSHHVTCNVTVFDTELTCRTSIGVGSGFQWEVTIGQLASSLSNQKTRYKTPTISRLCSPGECLYEFGGKPHWFADSGAPLEGLGTLATVGGEVVVVEGLHFGPAVGADGSSWPDGDNVVTMTYATFAADFGFQALDPTEPAFPHQFETHTLEANCTVTTAFTVMTCITSPGVGAHEHWTTVVGRQTSNPSANSTSYTPPFLVAVDALTFSRRVVSESVKTWPEKSPLEPFKANRGNVTYLVFDTPGQDVILIDGTNLGPATMNNSVTVDLRNPSLGHNSRWEGFSSRAATHHVLDHCRVTIPHVRIQCVMPPGVGFNHKWTVTIGSQVRPNF